MMLRKPTQGKSTLANRDLIQEIEDLKTGLRNQGLRINGAATGAIIGSSFFWLIIPILSNQSVREVIHSKLFDLLGYGSKEIIAELDKEIVTIHTPFLYINNNEKIRTMIANAQSTKSIDLFQERIRRFYHIDQINNENLFLKLQDDPSEAAIALKLNIIATIKNYLSRVLLDLTPGKIDFVNKLINSISSDNIWHCVLSAKYSELQFISNSQIALIDNAITMLIKADSKEIIQATKMSVGASMNRLNLFIAMGGFGAALLGTYPILNARYRYGIFAPRATVDINNYDLLTQEEAQTEKSRLESIDKKNEKIITTWNWLSVFILAGLIYSFMSLSWPLTMALSFAIFIPQMINRKDTKALKAGYQKNINATLTNLQKKTLAFDLKLKGNTVVLDFTKKTINNILFKDKEISHIFEMLLKKLDIPYKSVFYGIQFDISKTSSESLPQLNSILNREVLFKLLHQRKTFDDFSKKLLKLAYTFNVRFTNKEKLTLNQGVVELQSCLLVNFHISGDDQKKLIALFSVDQIEKVTDTYVVLKLTKALPDTVIENMFEILKEFFSAKPSVATPSENIATSITSEPVSTAPSIAPSIKRRVSAAEKSKPMAEKLKASESSSSTKFFEHNGRKFRAVPIEGSNIPGNHYTVRLFGPSQFKDQGAFDALNHAISEMPKFVRSENAEGLKAIISAGAKNLDGEIVPAPFEAKTLNKQYGKLRATCFVEQVNEDNFYIFTRENVVRKR